jgi:hypothetical protein
MTILNEKINKLNKINITFKYQSIKNVFMKKISSWTKDSKVKNPTYSLCTSTSVKEFLKLKSIADLNERWKNDSSFTFAKKNLKDHILCLSNFILKRKKIETKGLTALITGFGLFNKYRKTIGISKIDSCRLCGKSTPEDPTHLLLECEKTKPYLDRFINYKRERYLSTMPDFVRKLRMLFGAVPKQNSELSYKIRHYETPDRFQI